ncbi:MAG TPA: MraY family glycosyltransferase [Tepidisphaeraceae bacterium]|jgi:UDP-GlcNAc:undecaprenyl-phosphate GlcNAc-1-phosphate transferase
MVPSLLAQFIPDPFGAGHTLTANDVLEQYVWVFYGAFLISFLFTPLMRVVANYYGIIDAPDRLRKMHNVPVAYLGGMAVFLGWLTGLAISQSRRMPIVEPGLPINVTIPFSIVAGACIIIVLGLWDDLLGVRPWVKIAGQVAAAGFLIAENIGTRCTGLLFDTTNRWLFIQQQPGHWLANVAGSRLIQIPEWVTLVSSAVVVVCVVVACCNATNLMDGLDGLCGGVTAVIAGGFLFLAVHLAMSSGGLDPNLDSLRVVIALALLGAVMGFIPYNFNPASIFMGDTGSMFLGFCCATMIILMSQGQHWRWFLASMVMFALPVLDTALAFARRWVNRRPLFSADKLHFHHQLVARGFSVKKTVLISYGLALFFATAGALIAITRTRYAVAFYLIIFGYIIVAAYKMGMVHEKPRVVTRHDLADGVEPGGAAQIEPGTVIEIRESAETRGGDDVAAPSPATVG